MIGLRKSHLVEMTFFNGENFFEIENHLKPNKIIN